MKYKKGDEVKIIKHGSHKFQVGTLVTITDVDIDGNCYLAQDSDGKTWWIDYRHL